MKNFHYDPRKEMASRIYEMQNYVQRFIFKICFILNEPDRSYGLVWENFLFCRKIKIILMIAITHKFAN